MDFEPILARVDALLAKLEHIFPETQIIDWSAKAFKWIKLGNMYQLVSVHDVALIAFDDLKHIDAQKSQIRQNTEQFVKRMPANNVLLTGARGTGKSSLVKACLNAYAMQGLRLIEVDKEDLCDLYLLMEILADRPERFIIYCDDLSFNQGEFGYKALKVALDGTLSRTADNVLIYATSNRRHLMPEYHAENEALAPADEIHTNEAIEEKISLSERFGLWVSFYPFKQDDYLAIVEHWLDALGLDEAQFAQAHQDALIWALTRGSRSGRVAMQFAKHWVGANRLLLEKQDESKRAMCD